MAHLTDILDSNRDIDFEAVVPTDPVVTPDPDVILEPTPPSLPPFSVLSVASHLPPVTSSTIVNDDLFFEAYSVFNPLEFAFPVLTSLEDTSPSLPHAFIASALPYNSLLDSGCTHHIIRDCALFWDYDTTQAISVQTANCGSLSTLACGTVRFRVTSGNHSVVFILKGCLHAPDAPINLLSVGALTEKGATFTFTAGCMTISFPVTHPILPSFSFDAVPLRRLSFLDCDFISPSPSLPPTSSLLSLPDSALLTLNSSLPLTPALWHCL